MYCNASRWIGTFAAASLTAAALTACGAEAGPETVTPTAESPYSAVIDQMTQKIPTIMAEAKTVGLMVTLVDGDTVVWSQGFGFADEQAQTPVTANTHFHIGSVSKTLTAVAVMQLVEQGKVDLDAPLTQYVPEFTLRDPVATEAITVRSVLDHHSGIPGDVFNGMFTVDGPNDDFRSWLLDALAEMPPERDVDEAWAYNNSGYVLLANLIENVSGQTFVDYTRDNLFEPMAMPTSSFDDAAVSAEDLTSNYSAETDDAGTPTAAASEPREFINGYAAGSVTSSANEMANYLRMLLADGQGADGRVLPAGVLEQMWTPQVDLPLDTIPVRQGIGFLLGSPAMNWAGDLVWHNGATTWNYSNLQALPDSDLAVFVSGNTATPLDPSATVATETLALAYTAKTGTPKPPDASLPASDPAPLDPALLATYGGQYAAGASLDRLSPGPTADTLTLTRGLGTPGQADLTLQPRADGWLTIDGNPAMQMQFRTVAGRTLMFSRAPAGPSILELTEGERIPDGALDTAWAQRVGTYTPVDENPRNTEPFNNPTMTLSVTDGVLMLDAASGVGSGVLLPTSATEALTYGLGPSLGRNKGNLLAMTDDGTGFTFLGVTYVKQP